MIFALFLWVQFDLNLRFFSTGRFINTPHQEEYRAGQ